MQNILISLFKSMLISSIKFLKHCNAVYIIKLKSEVNLKNLFSDEPIS